MAGVVRLDKVQSIYNGNIFSVVSDEVLENGMVGVLGGLKQGERELHELVKPVDTAKPVVLIAAPEIVEEEYKRVNGALANFRIEAGTPARAYTLGATDIFSVSKDMVALIGADAVVGNHVIVEAGSLKVKEVAAVTGDEAFVAEIIDKETIGTATVIGQAGSIARRTDYVVLRVIKNA